MDDLPHKIMLNWSSGKDCAMALYELQQNKNYHVEKLFTTLNENKRRVAMHGIQEALIKAQAKAIGLPLELLYLAENMSMESYGKLIETKMQSFKEEEIYRSAFGDIALEDVKSYRENQLKKIGMKAVFPIWKSNTREMIQNFVQLNFKALVVAVAAEHFDESFLGTEIDEDFLQKLPEGVDPCGENGEFHTFCYDGPIFNEKLNFKRGEHQSRTYPNPKGKGEVIFHFLELLPI